MTCITGMNTHAHMHTASGLYTFDCKWLHPLPQPAYCIQHPQQHSACSTPHMHATHSHEDTHTRTQTPLTVTLCLKQYTAPTHALRNHRPSQHTACSTPSSILHALLPTILPALCMQHHAHTHSDTAYHHNAPQLTLHPASLPALCIQISTAHARIPHQHSASSTPSRTLHAAPYFYQHSACSTTQTVLSIPL